MKHLKNEPRIGSIMQITLRTFTDAKTMGQYRKLRWENFRKNSGLPFGSEYYEGEENGIYVGAFDGRDFIGGVFMIDRGNHNAQMHQIVVQESYRNKGVGSQLIDELEQMAKAQKVKAIYAHARLFLKDFYSKKGYTLIENKEEVPPNFSTHQQPGVPHVFMKKELH